MKDKDLGVFRFQGFGIRGNQLLHEREIIATYKAEPSVEAVHLDCKLHLINVHGANRDIINKPS